MPTKKTVTYTVYRFSELSKAAQDKAVSDEINFILEVTDYAKLSSNMKRAVDKAEQMRTPWFTGSYIWDYAKEEVFASVRQNNYLKDGSVFNG